MIKNLLALNNLKKKYNEIYTILVHFLLLVIFSTAKTYVNLLLFTKRLHVILPHLINNFRQSLKSYASANGLCLFSFLLQDL